MSGVVEAWIEVVAKLYQQAGVDIADQQEKLIAELDCHQDDLSDKQIERRNQQSPMINRWAFSDLAEALDGCIEMAQRQSQHAKAIELLDQVAKDAQDWPRFRQLHAISLMLILVAPYLRVFDRYLLPYLNVDEGFKRNARLYNKRYYVDADVDAATLEAGLAQSEDFDDLNFNYSILGRYLAPQHPELTRMISLFIEQQPDLMSPTYEYDIRGLAPIIQYGCTDEACLALLDIEMSRRHSVTGLLHQLMSLQKKWGQAIEGLDAWLAQLAHQNYGCLIKFLDSCVVDSPELVRSLLQLETLDADSWAIVIMDYHYENKQNCSAYDDLFLQLADQPSRLKGALEKVGPERYMDVAKGLWRHAWTNRPEARDALFGFATDQLLYRDWQLKGGDVPLGVSWLMEQGLMEDFARFGAKLPWDNKLIPYFAQFFPQQVDAAKLAMAGFEGVVKKSKVARESIAKRVRKLPLATFAEFGFFTAKVKPMREMALALLVGRKDQEAIDAAQSMLALAGITESEVAFLTDWLKSHGVEAKVEVVVKAARKKKAEDPDNYKVRKPDLVNALLCDDLVQAMAPLTQNEVAYLLDKAGSVKKFPMPEAVLTTLDKMEVAQKTPAAKVLLSLWDAQQAFEENDWGEAKLTKQSKAFDFIPVLVGYLGSDAVAGDIEKFISKYRKLHYHHSMRLMRTLGAIGSIFSLSILLEISKKRSFNWSMRDQAYSILDEVAKERDISMTDLEDLLVPDFGMTAEGLLLDVGDKHYRILLQSDLSLRVKNENTGKLTKSLPKAGKSEDSAKRALAEQTFKALNSNIKKVAKKQVPRMTEALIMQKSWPATFWQQQFVEHPLMRMMAQSLIWLDLGSQTSFRISEDLSLVTVDDEAHELSKDSQVCLFHPVLQPDAVAPWREHLADYEVTPMMDQLSRLADVGEPADTVAQLRSLSIRVLAGDVQKLANQWNLLQEQVDSWVGGYYLPIMALKANLSLTVDDYRLYTSYAEPVMVTAIEVEDHRRNFEPKDIPKPLLALALEWKQFFESRKIEG
ncbi:hypothetical protein CHH28_12230 [Bacterioplanes sanyensis]|uniref:DUF4132 domain-containing protein n=1 Tax=Bacterioplanes sanyensis TaxID=1249553 RepID=A0A222FL51_9GAMM|nr:DUF4132 domain-containing protein [Bacterioplanes sanyensis]ASP39392.1 hypothetical protein CHH28_12230 [Bacterioplanes sanyensis]